MHPPGPVDSWDSGGTPRGGPERFSKPEARARGRHAVVLSLETAPAQFQQAFKAGLGFLTRGRKRAFDFPSCQGRGSPGRRGIRGQRQLQRPLGPGLRSGVPPPGWLWSRPATCALWSSPSARQPRGCVHSLLCGLLLAKSPAAGLQMQVCPDPAASSPLASVALSSGSRSVVPGSLRSPTFSSPLA